MMSTSSSTSTTMMSISSIMILDILLVCQLCICFHENEKVSEKTNQHGYQLFIRMILIRDIIPLKLK